MDEEADRDGKKKKGRPVASGGRGVGAGGQRGRSAPDAAFDIWLQRGLHALYDEVAQEPIPDELLRLIQEDRKK